MVRAAFDPLRTLALMPSLEPVSQLPGTSVIIYSKLDRNKPCLIVRDAEAQSTISFDRSEDLMDDETIDLPLAPKKPYVRPQLHELAGSNSDGKAYPNYREIATVAAPS
jgi:hypothetical protein